MYHINWLLFIKLLLTTITLDGILCTIEGTYIPRPPTRTKHGDDPCHPLYWYPRAVPEYCHYKNMLPPPPAADPRPIPMPLPIPAPPLPIPMPIPMLPPMMPIQMPLPIGLPLSPSSPMLPVAFLPRVMSPSQPRYTSEFASYMPPYGIQRRPMSLVPGLPGLVSPDGGINVLPFSDAYADLLEKHKQKMIRRRLQKLLDEYDGVSWKDLSGKTKSRSRSRLRSRVRIMDDDLNDEDMFTRRKEPGSEEMMMMRNENEDNNLFDQFV